MICDLRFAIGKKGDTNLMNEAELKQRTKPFAPSLRHSDFGFVSSFVIRISSFQKMAASRISASRGANNRKSQI